MNALQLFGALGMLAVGVALIGVFAALAAGTLWTIRTEFREDRDHFRRVHPDWPRR